MRLAWEARENAPRPTEKFRTLPAGRYTVVGFRIVDRSRKDEVWHVSGSGPKLATIEVPASGELAIEVPAGLSIKSRFDGASAGMEIRGAFGAGVSIYRGGTRIPIEYRILSAAREELARGRMNYG